MKNEKIIISKTYRAIDIYMTYSAIEEWGLWRVLWGTDVFINNIPVLKSMVLVNFVVWLVMFVTFSS
jgi:hypothetical protein